MKTHDVFLPLSHEAKVEGNETESGGVSQPSDPFLAALLDDVEHDARAQEAQKSQRSSQSSGSVVASARPVSNPAPTAEVARIRYGLD